MKRAARQGSLHNHVQFPGVPGLAPEKDCRKPLAPYDLKIMATETHRTIEAIWRIESAKVIAGLSRLVRDVGLAEELAQDALVAALEQWPGQGIPDKLGAWRKPIGVASRRFTTPLRKSHLLQSLNSTAPSRSGWRSVPL